MEMLNKELFFYVFNFVAGGITTIAPGNSVQANITIDADADFVITDLFGYVYDAVAAVYPKIQLIQFTDNSTSKRFFSSPASVGLVLANMETINPLPVKRVLAASQTITVEISNPAGYANAVTPYVALRGYKVPRGAVGVRPVSLPFQGK